MTGKTQRGFSSTGNNLSNLSDDELLNLEDQLAEAMSEEIKKAIDAELIGTLLESTGWTKIALSDHFMQRKHPLNKNSFKSKVHTTDSYWYFESREEAEWFVLKWL